LGLAITQKPSSLSSWHDQFYFAKLIKQIIVTIDIIATETFANFRHVLPNAVSFWLDEIFYKKFSCFSFQLNFEKTQSVAKLFLYAPLKLKKNEHCTPVVFLHGDYGYPFTLHHLARLAANQPSRPIYNLYMPHIHRDADFKEQGAFIDRVISGIEKDVKDQGGIFDGVLAVGHSKGAMLLISRQFSAVENPKILRTFAVGGPIRDVDNCFSDELKKALNDTLIRIQQYTKRKFFQVIPKNDWSSPFKAMAVRSHEHCYVVPGMHLSGLYSSETTMLFKKFLCL